MIDGGFAEEAYGSAKKKSYQVSERFYNVYYLMRHSREGRRRLRWLVGFMQTFYSAKDYKHWAKRLEGELSVPLDGEMRCDKLAHLHALCAAADDGSRYEVFDALVRDALAHDDRRALDEEISEGDPIEKHGFHYLLAEVLWLLDKEQRQPLGFQPIEGNWWQLLRLGLLSAGLMPAAEQKIANLVGGRMDTARYANASGAVLQWLLHRPEEAEAAYRKALELDPENVYALNHLGITLDRQLRYSEAEASYLKTLELDPDYVYAHISLAGLYIDMGRIEAGITELLQGLQLNPDDEYGRHLLSQYWQSALPPAASKIATNEAGADNLSTALTEELIAQSASGAKDSVLNALLALDDNGKAIFEPLLLALQAQNDRGVLYRIAREKRELVLDVMARIDGENTLQQQSGNLPGGARDGAPFEQTVVDK